MDKNSFTRLLAACGAAAILWEGIEAASMRSWARGTEKGTETQSDRPAYPSALNPHSDLIFRATGATSCLDCHRAGKEGEISGQVRDNELVRNLKAKAKGIHGPGRFADCLRCHAGGDKGVEKYRK
jgi:hypothetical protein